MVKTYQLGHYGPYGTSIKIAPVTTEVEVNTNSCLQVNGTEEISISPQSILPALNGFECTGLCYFFQFKQINLYLEKN